VPGEGFTITSAGEAAESSNLAFRVNVPRGEGTGGDGSGSLRI